jgi:hypothetical protein
MTQAKTMKAASQVRVNLFLPLVYLVMAFGLGITGLISYGVGTNEELVVRILVNPWFAWGLFILQLIVVAVLSAAVLRMSAGMALLLFLLYSALTGLSISTIFVFYSQSAIYYTFWVTAGMFLFSSLIGLVIRRVLSGLGLFLLMALMGWLFAWFFVYLFPPSSGFDQMLTITGILLFAGLTTWDTQRLKQLSTQVEGRQGMGGLVVIGALALYLDFINLFLLLLRASRR